jgi:3alpha(or 20beta)-hydroxysteroid dehydrogenase
MGAFRLQGKVCLISGGAKGLGAAMARLFTMEGRSVAVGDILEPEGVSLVAEIT